MKQTKSILKDIPLVDIRMEDRARVEYKGMKSLVESIEQRGLLQPIAVCIEGDKYLLLCGGRRLMAHETLKLKMIACKIFPATLSLYEKKAIELEENIQREDLSYAEEAILTHKIHELYKMMGEDEEGKEHSIRDTAKILGKSKTSIGDELELATFIKAIPELGKLRNKSEALKFIRKAGSIAKINKVVAGLKEDRKNVPLDRRRKLLENSYFVMDFFKGVKSIDKRSIKLIDLDPDWGIDFKDKGRKVSALDYKQIEANEYKEFFKKTLDECFRVLQDDGWMIIWFGWQWYQYIIDALLKKGLKVYPVPAIWIKEGKASNNNPSLNLSSSYESFIYARKSRGRLYGTSEGRSTNFVFKQVIQGKRVHPAEKPVALLKEIYRTFIGQTGRVLHPFLGSGNGLLACADLGLIGFGYDLSQNNKNSYILKINNKTEESFEKEEEKKA